MTTKRDVQRILAPLATRHGDLAVVGRYIVLTPIRHYLRAVQVDRTGSAHVVNPRWFVYPMFKPWRFANPTWGCLLYRRSGSWRASDPEVPDELREEIERNALPILRSITSFADFTSLIRRGWTSPGKTHADWIMHHGSDKIVMHVALGEIEQARELATVHLSRLPDPSPKDADSYARHLFGLKRLKALLDAEDRSGMITVLHEWEAETVRNMKLEAYWQPSPFPIERG